MRTTPHGSVRAPRVRAGWQPAGSQQGRKAGLSGGAVRHTGKRWRVSRFAYSVVVVVTGSAGSDPVVAQAQDPSRHVWRSTVRASEVCSRVLKVQVGWLWERLYGYGYTDAGHAGAPRTGVRKGHAWTASKKVTGRGSPRPEAGRGQRPIQPTQRSAVKVHKMLAEQTRSSRTPDTVATPSGVRAQG